MADVMLCRWHSISCHSMPCRAVPMINGHGRGHGHETPFIRCCSALLLSGSDPASLCGRFLSHPSRSRPGSRADAGAGTRPGLGVVLVVATLLRSRADISCEAGRLYLGPVLSLCGSLALMLLSVSPLPSLAFSIPLPCSPLPVPSVQLRPVQLLVFRDTLCFFRFLRSF